MSKRHKHHDDEYYYHEASDEAVIDRKHRRTRSSEHKHRKHKRRHREDDGDEIFLERRGNTKSIQEEEASSAPMMSEEEDFEENELIPTGLYFSRLEVGDPKWISNQICIFLHRGANAKNFDKIRSGDVISLTLYPFTKWVVMVMHSGGEGCLEDDKSLPSHLAIELSTADGSSHVVEPETAVDEMRPLGQVIIHNSMVRLAQNTANLGICRNQHLSFFQTVTEEWMTVKPEDRKETQYYNLFRKLEPLIDCFKDLIKKSYKRYYGELLELYVELLEGFREDLNDRAILSENQNNVHKVRGNGKICIEVLYSRIAVVESLLSRDLTDIKQLQKGSAQPPPPSQLPILRPKAVVLSEQEQPSESLETNTKDASEMIVDGKAFVNDWTSFCPVCNKCMKNAYSLECHQAALDHWPEGLKPNWVKKEPQFDLQPRVKLRSRSRVSRPRVELKRRRDDDDIRRDREVVLNPRRK